MWRILTILWMLAGSLQAETVKELPKPTSYVSDYAGVLDEDAKASIEAQCTALHQKTGTQIAVVTIHKLEGGTAAEFAQGISDAWGVGSKGTDKGVVMLFSIDDHKRWINVGYGLEGQLNDAKVGDIGRHMVPLLKQANYREAIGLGVAEVSDAISADPSQASAPAPPTPTSLTPLFFIAACFGGVILFMMLLLRFRNRQPTIGEVKHQLGMPIITPGSSDSSGTFFSSSSSDNSSDSSSSDSSSDFGGFDGGSSGGGGAGGDW